MKKLSFIFLLAIFTLFTVMGCTSHSPKKSVSTYVVTENTQILQSMKGDLLGDQREEKILLYAEQAKDGLPLAWALVVDDVEKVRLTPEEGLYFFAEMNLSDVDGDGQKEVLLYRQSSGSAGARALNIYQTTEDSWQEIFAVDHLAQTDDEHYQVKYLGDFYVSFEDKKTGLKSTIPLDKNQYQGSEEMLNNITTWIDPVAAYSLVDHDGDGCQEIVTLQRVIGVSHVDTIALLKTTYYMTNGHYQAVNLALCDNKNKILAEVKLQSKS